MSRYWGYRCKQDGATSDAWFNHGERILRSCVTCWPLIRQIGEQDTSQYIEVHIMGHLGEEGEVWSFLSEHYGHGLELCDEYGNVEPLEQQS